MNRAQVMGLTINMQKKNTWKKRTITKLLKIDYQEYESVKEFNI